MVIKVNIILECLEEDIFHSETRFMRTSDSCSLPQKYRKKSEHKSLTFIATAEIIEIFDYERNSVPLTDFT